MNRPINDPDDEIRRLRLLVKRLIENQDHVECIAHNIDFRSPHVLELCWSAFSLFGGETAETAITMMSLPKLLKAESIQASEENLQLVKEKAGQRSSAKQAKPCYDMYFEVANLRLGRGGQ